MYYYTTIECGGTLDLGGAINGTKKKMLEMGEMPMRLPSGGEDKVSGVIGVDTGVFEAEMWSIEGLHESINVKFETKTFERVWSLRFGGRSMKLSEEGDKG